MILQTASSDSDPPFLTLAAHMEQARAYTFLYFRLAFIKLDLLRTFRRLAFGLTFSTAHCMARLTCSATVCGRGNW